MQEQTEVKKSKSQRRVIQVDEKVPFLEGLPLSFQHLFAMFGASVLVPALINGAAGKQVIDPSLVLLMNGIGTLIYLFLCKGKAPAFLGSSFAFIAPTIAVVTSSSAVGPNFQKALGGYIICGLIFVIVSQIIGKAGTRWLDIVLPPAAMGPIVALIGLDLAGTAAGMAGLVPANGTFDHKAIIISLFTLAIFIIGTIAFKGFLGVIPVLIAIAAGYGLSACMGYLDTTPITDRSFFNLPHFVTPIFNISAIGVIAPAALVVISEHIGHLFVTSNIVGRDLTKDPGLHRSMLGDGLSTMLSGFGGSCPTTTYGENMGVMALTKVYSVWVIGGAAVISIIIAFFGKIAGVINSIPQPVMGGISLLLFGTIAASGIRMIVESKIDYSKSKNLVLTAVIFVVGVSGIKIEIAPNVPLSGMVLATIVGIFLSLFMYIIEKLGLNNDVE